MFVKEKETRRSVTEVMSTRFRIETLTAFPCPEMTLERVIVPPLSVWYILPIISGIFLGTNG